MKRPPVPVPGINNVAKRIVGRRDSVLARKNIRDSLVSVAGLIGRPVRDIEGKDIGRLVDVVVRHGEETYPPVSGLIVKVGQRKSFINGARISILTKDEIRLSTTKINLEDYQRREGESLLDGDVIDHQIVDVDGLRVVRSSDLYLAPFDKEIRVVGVDISFVSFLRRIFPGAIRRRPTPEHVVDWASVASLADGHGVVRTSNSRAALSQLRPADLADLIEDLAGREQGALIELLDPELAADVLEEMEEEELQGLIRGLTSERSAELLSRMEPDESAEVLRDLDEEHRESILQVMDAVVAKQLRELVAFDETLAGGIMTTHILIVKEVDTVAHALKLLVDNRERDISDGVVVVDARGRLVDHIQVVELVAAKAGDLLSSLIGPPYPTSINLDTPLDEVVEEFSNNRGSSVIVVDAKNKPVGRILADDLVDALASQVDRRKFSQGSGGLS
ncbi:MAG: CBS domain-containing protein [Actinomycetes bacterium]|jgi:CBS domain-containing protein/flagellar motility protein MotE (MotC chaperone)/sporulation protein YlmC with PRC-barrel domain